MVVKLGLAIVEPILPVAAAAPIFSLQPRLCLRERARMGFERRIIAIGRVAPAFQRRNV